MKRHATLRQRRLDYLGQASDGLVQGADGRVLLAQGQLPDGVTPVAEMPVDGALSTAPEQLMSDEQLRAGIARLVREEELTPFGNTLHRRPDNRLEEVPVVPVSLRPGAFRVAHMGERDWLVQGGEALFSRYERDENGIWQTINHATVTIEDKVIHGFREGWIVAHLRGHMLQEVTSGYFLIASLTIEAAEGGLVSDYHEVRDQDGIATVTMTHGMMPIAWVMAPGARSNAGPVIFDRYSTGNYQGFMPSQSLFHGNYPG